MARRRGLRTPPHGEVVAPRRTSAPVMHNPRLRRAYHHAPRPRHRQLMVPPDLRSAPPGRSSRLRMALGAPSTGIAWRCCASPLVLVAAGVTAGVGTVLLAGRLVASLISRPRSYRPGHDPSGSHHPRRHRVGGCLSPGPPRRARRPPDRAPGRVSSRTGRSSSLSRADLSSPPVASAAFRKRRTSQPRRAISAWRSRRRAGRWSRA